MHKTMKCNHHDLEFELKDEWLVETNMIDFVPTESSYRPDLAQAKGQEVLKIPIYEIAPLKERAKCRGVFCDNERETAKERVFRILKWFREYQEIEPIGVVRLKENEKYKYKVVDGSHRFHCSIAVGFSKVPAIFGFDADDVYL